MTSNSSRQKSSPTSGFKGNKRGMHRYVHSVPEKQHVRALPLPVLPLLPVSRKKGTVTEMREREPSDSACDGTFSEMACDF